MIDRQALDSRIKLAEFRFGKTPSYQDLEQPISLVNVATGLVRDYGIVRREDDKLVNVVHLQSVDPLNPNINYIWRLKDSEVEIDPNTNRLRTTGDLSQGLIIEGFELIGIETNLDKGFVPYKLQTLNLPRVMDQERLLELAAKYGPEKIMTTANMLNIATIAHQLLFEAAQTKDIITGEERMFL